MRVVVQLMHGSRQLAYTECTLSEAKERLARKMQPGFRYTIPLWQFGDADTPVADRDAERERVVKLIRAAPDLPPELVE